MYNLKLILEITKLIKWNVVKAIILNNILSLIEIMTIKKSNSFSSITF